jgi:hypothetical protein
MVQSVSRQGNTTIPGWQMPAPIAAALLGLLLAGCGINKSRLATEQLVVSDAVDRAVASIDFSPLSGSDVYFDTKYVDNVTIGPGGSMQYVISSLRQQMLAYNCRLQEKPDNAEFIIEARVGVLQQDGHEVTYGIPGSAALGTASLLMASPIALPSLPELSLGRRNDQSGTAKIGLFAYDRESREPVWQAGVTKGSSHTRDTWILGLGPYQKRSASTTKAPQRKPWQIWKKTERISTARDPLAAYSNALVFERAVEKAKAADQPDAPAQDAGVATVSHTQPAAEPAKAAAEPARPAAEPAKIVPAADAKPAPLPSPPAASIKP